MTQESVYFDTAVNFIRSLGISVTFNTLPPDTFLPGILISNGELIVDRALFAYPGDILHEAGHIAVVPANERSTLHNDNIAGREHREAEEMMAIAWSYAACVHLGIDPYFVFHENGYHGTGKSIADNFKNGQYFGVPMLQVYGMSAEPHQAQRLSLPAFPEMAKWLRD
ncbi:hypothetical protein SAMN05444266_103271 [Chitinophaga jiangningensis]|uniref:Uncharacterized protein n=1 Tax=Chitinophaga jiangningensis TaxID=1419482 RepID=A0A1M7AGC4_9BACT|nr:hypothetical protein [Chitinophaga jiangningensis]SHL41843.1 hypothetical protein SAMN05444266_103271 [Chitinophaga jiangningensis]